jgi:membrane protein DedA with SNARE-associated domain/pimeloyl-ACP methyl ester carboxylesterase
MALSTPTAQKTRIRIVLWGSLFYLLLLGLSHLVRAGQPDPYSAPEGLHTITLKRGSQQGQGGQTAPPVVIRYIDTDPLADARRPVILLVHGSPAPASAVFNELAAALASDHRVVAPDLPGFGYSTRRIPDYGFASHAAYLQWFMEDLGLSKVHLVAYSMGGGPAIRLAAGAREKVASLSLVSALGVQELELLGDYHLNHLLHGAQLALVWAFQELIPHMGILDRIYFNRRYARNFYDADQRPLRALLQQVEQPVLILHGDADRFVIPGVAREHARLVPQSALNMVDGGHLVLLRQPSAMAALIGDFVAAAASGKGINRAAAPSERSLAAADPLKAVRLEPARGMLLVVYSVLIALATLVSEDLACIGAGLLAARGIIGFLPAVAASLLGIVVGDLLLFMAGRVIGRRAVSRAPLKWFITSEDVDMATGWFNQRGPAIIIASRFLPGSRLPTYFTAGILGTSPSLFLFYFCIAALLWTPVLVGLAMLLGQSLLSYYALFQHYALGVLLCIVLLLYGIIHLVVPLFSFRGRRLLLGKYRRLRHWEFWPLPVVYAPVVVYILLLGIGRRHLTLFTAANPGMPASGIVGESKSDILERLRPSGVVADFRRIPCCLPVDDQLAQVQRFMVSRNLAPPVVFKPDKGERGKDVEIISSEKEMRLHLERARCDTIVQEYVPGREFGVFYYRCPGQSRGHIFSLTDKRPISVTGDGVSTLETLILKDERAVCKAPLHFRVHRNRLFSIPAPGETVQLVDVGTHARGALFLDAGDLVTDAMAAAFDAVSRHFDGFYFGRYDIRTASVEAFQNGGGFKVLELNGVTSEATHIYDPGNSLLSALRDLMRQWKIAIEIGQRNRRNGVHPLSATAFLKLVLAGGVP